MIKLSFLYMFLAAYSTAVHAENRSADLPYAGTAPTAPEPAGIKVTTKIDAKSCNFADVSAVATNAEAGTQVNIPAGNCDWGMNALKVGAGVYLKGAGKNLTVISRSRPAENDNPEKTGAGSSLITFNCAPGRPNTLSNLSLQGSGNGGEKLNGSDQRENGLTLNGWKYSGNVRLSSACEDFRVFNSKFSGFGSAAITINGDPTANRGVIFNNDFTHNYFYHPRHKAVILGYGVVVYGDGSWPALSLGTANNIFIENNYMVGNRHHVASNNSSRYVFRYNTTITTASGKNDFALDAHGRAAQNGSPTGSRQFEIYGNVISTDLPANENARTAIGIRGGDGVIFNNSIGAQFRYGLELMIEGGYDASGKLTCKDPPDRTADLYIWDNKLPMPNASINGVISVCPEVVKIDQHYFLQTKKGYLPFTYPHPLR
jgi:hypothetical protein